MHKIMILQTSDGTSGKILPEFSIETDFLHWEADKVKSVEDLFFVAPPKWKFTPQFTRLSLSANQKR